MNGKVAVVTGAARGIGRAVAIALANEGASIFGIDICKEDARKILISRSPLGVPWIEPVDVTPIVVFLASDQARMVSGATFDATGGDSAHYS